MTEQDSSLLGGAWSDKKKWVMGILAAVIVFSITAGLNAVFSGSESDEEKLCRDPSHGIERYEFSDTVEQNSGWVASGYNEAWWCQKMKNDYQSNRPDISIIWGNQVSSQRYNKDSFGHVTYNYYCKVTAKWNPIYNLKHSEACL